jgi:polyphosphate kinase
MTRLPLLNRELSRLDYNRRVLARAEDDDVPLLERLRFVAYCSKNMDEFFMVRAGSIRDRIDAGVNEPTADGLMPDEQMQAIRERARAILADMYTCLNDRLLPSLRDHRIAIEHFRELTTSEQSALRDLFVREIAPLLTPLAIDPGHPFPFITNLTLFIAARLLSTTGPHLVLLKVHSTLPHFVAVGERRFVPIGSLIMANLPTLLPTLELEDAVLFRLVRNSELSIDEDEVEDLQASIESQLRVRARKQIVYLEIDATADDTLVDFIVTKTGASADDVYRVGGFLKASDLLEISERVTDRALHYPGFNPRLPRSLVSADDIFAVIRRGDVLLNRPYDSFAAVIELLHAAAVDPAVRAIKQTLYKTDQHSPVVEKLVIAARSGKQVSVVIELQARFEESRNIAWARQLEEAGVQVVYGIVGLECHAKVCLIAREEDGSLRRYVHLSTGNYNVDSARTYTDVDLLTCDEEITEDAGRLMNMVTGFSSASLSDAMRATTARWNRFVVAPFDYERWVLEMINREIGHAQAGRPSGIRAKLNSLVEPHIISRLYAASQSGVDIELVVRSICCLVPGVEGISSRIQVVSIIDRFLEHGRIFQFENGGQPELYLSSGDWMPRNFNRRIEVTFPLVAETTRRRASAILDAAFEDHAAAWTLQPTGSWTRRTPSPEAISSQERFIREARLEAIPIGGYKETIEKPDRFRRRARRTRRPKSP